MLFRSHLRPAPEILKAFEEKRALRAQTQARFAAVRDLPAVTRDGVPIRLELRESEGYYINPGSVGQPRDRDPRAVFAIYDTKGYIEYRRVPYDIESTVRKMQEAKLPEFLSYRLTVGR